MNDEVARRPRDLIGAEDQRRLSQRSDVLGLTWFAGHLALIGAGGWLTWQAWLHGPAWAFVMALALHSVVIGFLFSPLHECAHGTAFKTRWLNETALWITALLYVVPPYFFRYFHLGHHRFTQVKGKDPSLVLPEPATFRQYLWYCAGLWFWWRNLAWMVRHTAGQVSPASEHYVPADRRGLMVVEARIMMAVYGALALAALAIGVAGPLLIGWLLPRLLGEPVQRIMRVAEHVGCDESADLLANTRTTLTNPITNTLAWMMPYHAEHHLYPNVPFHKLAALHQLVAHRVIVEPRGYLAGQAHIIRWLWARKADAGPAGAMQTPVPPPSL